MVDQVGSLSTWGLLRKEVIEFKASLGFLASYNPAWTT